MQQKIAFIQKGDVPLENQYIAKSLQTYFPNLEVEIIDIKHLLTRRRDIELANLLFTIKEYGLDITARKKVLKDSFFRTTYLFRRIKELMAQKLNNQEYLFSFQVQSLYDASYPGLPHFVYTDHTNLANLLYPHQDYNQLFPDTWIRLEQTIYQNACHVFTRSHNITHSVISQYGCDVDKVSCVYAGSNVNFDHAPLQNNDYQNKNILFVGIDWERKGGPELIAAFRQVLKVHPDAHLTIVGCSPEIDLPQCHVVGRIPLKDVEAYYRQASIFCLPTRREPFGIVFIEAFAHKLPIVAPRVGAIPDFVIPGESGYLVESGETGCLANALIELLDDPAKCKAYGQKGYEIIREDYTWEKVGQRLQATIASKLEYVG